MQEVQQERDGNETRLASELSIEGNECIFNAIGKCTNSCMPASLKLRDQQFMGRRNGGLTQMTVLPKECVSKCVGSHRMRLGELLAHALIDLGPILLRVVLRYELGEPGPDCFDNPYRLRIGQSLAGDDRDSGTIRGLHYDPDGVGTGRGSLHRFF